jgi:hypothetical protein
MRTRRLLKLQGKHSRKFELVEMYFISLENDGVGELSGKYADEKHNRGGD